MQILSFPVEQTRDGVQQIMDNMTLKFWLWHLKAEKL